MTASPYFTCRAREAFEKCGGDPDNAGPLAEWAQDTHSRQEEYRAREGRDIPLAVFVGIDGTIHAELTHGFKPWREAWYVSELFTDDARASIPTTPGAVDGLRFEPGLAIARLQGSIKRRLHSCDSDGICPHSVPGAGIVRIHYSSVCFGRCACGQHKRPLPSAPEPAEPPIPF